jgi:hypothetical protein
MIAEGINRQAGGIMEIDVVLYGLVGISRIMMWFCGNCGIYCRYEGDIW